MARKPWGLTAEAGDGIEGSGRLVAAAWFTLCGCGGTSRQLRWRWSPVWRHRWHAMAQRGSDGSGEGAQEDDESGRAGWRSSVESVVELIEER